MARGKPPASTGQHAYVPPPRPLPAFPDALRVQPKGTRRRWIDDRGFLYEWDYRHGTVEVYNARGRHIGEFDHRTGRRLKPADRIRRIDP
jgi:Cytotoxic